MQLRKIVPPFRFAYTSVRAVTLCWSPCSSAKLSPKAFQVRHLSSDPQIDLRLNEINFFTISRSITLRSDRDEWRSVDPKSDQMVLDLLR